MPRMQYSRSGRNTIQVIATTTAKIRGTEETAASAEQVDLHHQQCAQAKMATTLAMSVNWMLSCRLLLFVSS